MGTGSTLIILGLIATAVWAQNLADLPNYTNQPEQGNPDGSNVVVGPGGSIIRNSGGTFLGNDAGQIYRGKDGRTVLINADGQQIITNSDDSSEEDISTDGDDQRYAFSGNRQAQGVNIDGNNVVINGGQGAGTSYINQDGHSFIYNVLSENSYYISNGHSVKIVNGGIQLIEGGKEYTFLPRAADVNQKETVDINGQTATVEYNNGNVVIQLADQTVIAKLENNFFMGDRYSYENREKLQAEAQEQAKKVTADVAKLQKNIQENLNAAMQELQRNLNIQLSNLPRF